MRGRASWWTEHTRRRRGGKRHGNHPSSRVDWRLPRRFAAFQPQRRTPRRLILSPVGFWLWRCEEPASRRRCPSSGRDARRLRPPPSGFPAAGAPRTRSGRPTSPPRPWRRRCRRARPSSWSSRRPRLRCDARDGNRGTVREEAGGPRLFTFADVAALRAAVERVASGGEPERISARSIGRDMQGEVVSEWTSRGS